MPKPWVQQMSHFRNSILRMQSMDKDRLDFVSEGASTISVFGKEKPLLEKWITVVGRITLLRNSSISPRSSTLLVEHCQFMENGNKTNLSRNPSVPTYALILQEAIVERKPDTMIQDKSITRSVRLDYGVIVEDSRTKDKPQEESESEEPPSQSMNLTHRSPCSFQDRHIVQNQEPDVGSSGRVAEIVQSKVIEEHGDKNYFYGPCTINGTSILRCIIDIGARKEHNATPDC